MFLPGLKAARAAKALTQRELAKESKVSYTTIASLEMGDRGALPGTVRKLAKALRVKPTTLYETPRDDHGQVSR